MDQFRLSVYLFWSRTHKVNEQVHDSSDIPNDCFWCEEQPVGNDFDTQFKGHGEDEEVVTDLERTKMMIIALVIRGHSFKKL